MTKRSIHRFDGVILGPINVGHQVVSIPKIKRGSMYSNIQGHLDASYITNDMIPR